MPRMRLILFGLVVLAAGGALLTTVLIARAKARAQADWFVGKNLTLAPVVRGLKEPTFVAGPPDGSNYVTFDMDDGSTPEAKPPAA